MPQESQVREMRPVEFILTLFKILFYWRKIQSGTIDN